MELTGYTDRWTVRPGETITFHIHCTAPRYDAALVRLIHGDTNPLGPGFREVEVESPVDGTYEGEARTIRKGSYAVLPCSRPDGRVTLELWLRPTLPGPERQGIAVWTDATGTPVLGLFLAPDGTVEAGNAGAPDVRAPRPLAVGRWYRLALAIDTWAGRLTLSISPRRWEPDFGEPDRAEGALPDRLATADGRLVLAAAALAPSPDGPRPVGVLNGRLARPRLLGPDGTAPLAGWDFHREAGTARIAGIDGTGDGHTVNRPMRLATGPDWPCGTQSCDPTPETHDAIHFHDDDVADVGWPASQALTIPDDLPSGVYALRLRTPSAEDHLPFFVCPRPGGATAKLAVLMPTMSYLAYSNESLDVREGVQMAPRQAMDLQPEAYAYVARNGLKSTYDKHRDGSGIAYASRRRPIIDFRPKARCRTFDAPHQFPADLHLVDWLTQKGYAFDVLTDDLLHREGAAALAPYRTVITGSHPEYWTTPMLDARDAWLDAGGRLMYLGGNGFYWVTGVAEDDPDLIEIRRCHGTRTWTAEPGEETLSLTGERGGLWLHRGRAPEVRLGVGFTGQGFDRGQPFHRSPESHASEWAWIFAGVDGDVIGAGRSLVLGHGAAGFEVDKANPVNGTPAHAVVLASTRGFTDAYQAAVETFDQVTPWLGGSDPRSGIQGDILFMAGPNGGAVFSAGSITWSATLSAKDYDSDTARITANVLNAFLGETLPMGAP